MSSKRQVAIIGAGVSGLAAASYLCAEGCQVTIYEQKPSAGGLWNRHRSRFEVEQPVYESLETNVPRQLMTFSDKKWRADVQLMPHNSSVSEYLQEYELELLAKYGNSRGGEETLHIEYNSKVVRVEKLLRNYTAKWGVEANVAQYDKQKRTESSYFDAVVVAAGSHQEQYCPIYPGIEDWFKKGPRHLIHSIEFDNPASYKDKNVLILGYSASGYDISVQLTPEGVNRARNVYISTGRPSQPFAPGIRASHIMPRPKRFDAATRSVTFVNGATVTDIDSIILCTGYKYNFDFITTSRNGDVSPLFPTGPNVNNIYQHIFYISDNTLAFVGLPTRGASFIIAEAQSAVIARAFANRLPVISKTNMQAEYDRWLAEQKNRESQGNGDIQSYHKLGQNADKEYVNMLCAWAAEVPTIGQSKLPPYWCGCMDTARQLIGEARALFKKLSPEEKKKYPSYESLGFSTQKRCTIKHNGGRGVRYASCYLS
ncbi:hypothetical protein AC578_10060 [Pseudocercospora eumusae]|uniref:FAD dependent oxidoreductase domain-containing protein n=1 Tax=Pseudocercospora eumusae TaxID=321146 RepID=A0A139H890_9PEZI|nr:hypothetical protein AC578_10060 [Pseudocercospora eumusae]KXS98672.1 hypothetical protein AC578_10060 [Pseudocercospora eumusae]